MAAYSYKQVCSRIPAKYADAFTKLNGETPDNNPNYDGDYWLLTSMWIDDLLAEIRTLRAARDAAKDIRICKARSTKKRGKPTRCREREVNDERS